MSSRHEGVSCDGCMAPNFTGDRYKCLRCYDFDLCSRCYTEERRGKQERSRDSNTNHQPTHPMQCIMTQIDFERTYRGDPNHSWERSRVVIFTCPVCGAEGFPRERLVTHVIEEHPSAVASSSSSSHSRREEMACPICISTDSYRIGFADCVPNHLTDMAAHMIEYHTHQATTPSNGMAQSGQSAAAGFTEYLRDEDLRRVILNNIPLMGDVEVDELLPESARRYANALLSSSRPANAAHSRRRADRSANEPGHEEEGSSQMSATARILAHGSRNAGFGRHWQPVSVSQRQNGIAIFNSLPFRLRPLRQAEADGSRAATPNTQPTTTTLRSFFHREPPTGNVTSRTTQPVGVLTRQIRRPQQGSTSERTATDSSSRQSTSRGSGRLPQADRSSGPRYSREMMRSILESSRRNEPQPLARKTQHVIEKVKLTLKNDESEVDKTGVASIASKGQQEVQRSEKQPASSGSQNTRPTASTSLRRVDSASADESVVKEPLFVERAGRPLLLLPLSPQRAKSVDRVETSKKSPRRKKAPKKEVNVTKDSKNHPNGKPARRKRGKPQAAAGRQQRILLSYQPLFTSSAKASHPLPALSISKDSTQTSVWSEPQPIPDAKVIEKRESDEDDESCVEEKDEVSPPSLIISVGRPIQCTYIAPDEKDNLYMTASGVKIPLIRDPKDVSVRRTLEAIKKMEEARRASLQHSSISTTRKAAYSGRGSVEEGRHTRRKTPPSAGVTKSQGSYNVFRVDEMSRMDSTDRFQNAFKEPTEDLLLAAVVAEKRSCFKPFRIVSEECSKNLVSLWRETEGIQDDERIGLGFNLDETVKNLLAQIPDFDCDDYGGESSVESGDDEPMFDSSEGSDEELLAKKCISCGITQSPSPYFVLGPVNSALGEKENYDNDYWKSYRFLHNRRDVFHLRKSIETLPENKLDSSDWRFVRQLLFGVRDAAASKFLRCHFFTDAFDLLLECNLRNMIISRNEPEATEQAEADEELSASEGQVSASDTQFKLSFDTVPARMVSDTRILNVNPVLWHLLDLGKLVTE